MAAMLVATLIPLTGCNSGDEEDLAPQPQVVEFKGKVSSELVGSWRAETGRSGLDLAMDGNAKILVVSASPSGDVKSDIDGKWLCHGKDLLLRYTAKGQPESTVKYTFKLAGSTLTLTQGAGRMKTVYRRK